MSFHVLDPFSPNTEAPRDRVAAAKELLAWVLGAVFRKQEKTIDQFDYYPNYMYRLPAQKDGVQLWHFRWLVHGDDSS